MQSTTTLQQRIQTESNGNASNRFMLWKKLNLPKLIEKIRLSLTCQYANSGLYQEAPVKNSNFETPSLIIDFRDAIQWLEKEWLFHGSKRRFVITNGLYCCQGVTLGNRKKRVNQAKGNLTQSTFWKTTNTGVSEASWLAWFSDVRPNYHQHHRFDINWRRNTAQKHFIVPTNDLENENSVHKLFK